ncbi:unnamed protein product, partial [marine sediment metagenome]
LQSEPDLPESSIPESGEKAPMAKYWWLNTIRGIAALLLGLGSLLSLELVLDSEQIQAMSLQFMGIYLFFSGIMSFIWGLTKRRKLGLWIVAGTLGVAGGIAFILNSSLEYFQSTELLLVVVGIIMLLIGLVHILGGFRLSEALGRRWASSHFFLGVVEIALGILALVSIFVTVDILRYLLSFWGIIAGAGLILDGRRLRRAATIRHAAHQNKEGA